VTNLSAKFSAAAADITPAANPDLYRDEPLVLAAKLDTLKGSVEIKGNIGDRPWVVTLPLAGAAEGKGLSKLWARRKISDAEVARTTRQAAPEDADKTILALALEHQLVTRLTSLIAVDKTPSRPEGAPLKASELPINLPAGWESAVSAEGTSRRRRRRPRSGRDAETPDSYGRAGAGHGQAAEDGDLFRIEDDRRLDPAGAQRDAVPVQPASDGRELTPRDGGGPPTFSFKARAAPPSPRVARAALSTSLRAQRSNPSGSKKKEWIASSLRSSQ
jgi:hypothetical protein